MLVYRYGEMEVPNYYINATKSVLWEKPAYFRKRFLKILIIEAQLPVGFIMFKEGLHWDLKQNYHINQSCILWGNITVIYLHLGLGQTIGKHKFWSQNELGHNQTYGDGFLPTHLNMRWLNA